MYQSPFFLGCYKIKEAFTPRAMTCFSDDSLPGKRVGWLSPDRPRIHPGSVCPGAAQRKWLQNRPSPSSQRNSRLIYRPQLVPGMYPTALMSAFLQYCVLYRAPLTPPDTTRARSLSLITRSSQGALVTTSCKIFSKQSPGVHPHIQWYGKIVWCNLLYFIFECWLKYTHTFFPLFHHLSI